ncbi:acyl carrier protein [Streptomyces sp. KL118A]|uniref:acyl carrier protein n=1 Tax=Streptomyces sp. KL118A TaxID=3045153 RepID=UPI00278BFD30|nr:acyl carrier protein [Streptomyces sp. KL118A]
MSPDQALTVIKDSITQLSPDADFTGIGPHDKFRDVLELDSIDFLSLVELLCERTGIRIEEDDYPELTTLADAAELVASRTR